MHQRPLLSSLVTEEIRASGDISFPVSGIASDSREVKPGFVFAAIKGAKDDGAKYIPAALANGAAAILAEEMPENCPVPVLLAKNPRRALALLAAGIYAPEPSHIAAVTGTNGKTSAVNFARQIWENLGCRAASIGTIGIVEAGETTKLSADNTTPDPAFLSRSLQGMKERGTEYVALEASSIGLDQFRLDGIRIEAAAFTNFTRDHLDYHGGMEEYLRAKLRLFAELAPGVAVLNADIPEYKRIRETCRGEVITYGEKGDLRRLTLNPLEEGQRLVFEASGKRHDLILPLIGGFQAENALCALGIAIATGMNPEKAAGALASLKSVPGRMEKAGTKKGGGSVYVDYAHTPDALMRSLASLKSHCRGKLGVVFGCGGDRDKGKRPQMGEIAAGMADFVVVTDDNPRSENPAQIRKEVMGALKMTEIGDRREAINFAVEKLEAGDILLIAGKGHEKKQIIGSEEFPFDDLEEARRALL